MRLRPPLLTLLVATVVVVAAAPASADIAEGRVFRPNPIVALQDQNLTDQKDADTAELQAAYQVVELTNLDDSGNLIGDFADVRGTRNRASSEDGGFFFDRSHQWFEQVMAYHAITEAQRYIQSLGLANVNNEPQDVRVHQFGGDNSFYDPKKDIITIGKGGVDDGEDMEVIWHEYGHAIQDAQVIGFGTNHDSNAIGEGFGDYWAATMSEPFSQGYGVTCIAEWDATSYTPGEDPHCLRRVDLDLTVDDQTGGIHHDGQIWSRALWDIHTVLGREVADRIILTAQFDFAVNTSFRDAALDTVGAAQALGGDAAAAVVQEAFAGRGIL
jgi:hypothetical protein